MPGERTEQATQHRREKARKEGDILHSRELSAAAGTLAGVHGAGALGGRGSLIAGATPSPGFSISGHRLAGSRRTLAANAARHAPAGASSILAPASLVMCGGGRGRSWCRSSADRRSQLPRSAPSASGSTASIRSRTSRICSRCAPPPGWASRFFRPALLAVFAVQRIARQLTIATLFNGAAGDAGRGCLRTAAGRGLAALRLVGDRLPGGVAEPRVAPEDEPPGHARGVQGDRRQPADPRPHPQICSARCAAAG